VSGLTPAAVEYLVVDRFIAGLPEAAALRTALDIGLIDALVPSPVPQPVQTLRAVTGADLAGLSHLLRQLQTSGVIQDHEQVGLALTPEFRVALGYRDLLELKLEFALIAASDYALHLTAMVTEPMQFLRHSRMMRMVDRGRCLDRTPENLRHAWQWMRLTTQITRHEARACLELLDLSTARRLLDVGGNSPEFALQACRRYAGLLGTVVDLPVICELGAAWVLSEPERERMAFRALDYRREALPGGHDLIVFNSMLHDWPLPDALALLERAAAALEPGGRLLIFERMPLQHSQFMPGFSSLPTSLRFRAYREPQVYAAHLQALGLADLHGMQVQLDVAFFVLTARKAHA
jgi:SAM-dependent methyltransferase